MGKTSKSQRAKAARELTSSSMEIVAAAAAAGASTGSSIAAATAALLRLFPKVLGLSVGHLFHRKERQVSEWWEHLAQDQDRTVEEVQRLIAEHIDEPVYHEVIVESARKLLDAVDDVATIPLAALTSEYLGKKKPDRFFRGLSRLLADISESEFESLRTLTRGLARSKSAPPFFLWEMGGHVTINAHYPDDAPDAEPRWEPVGEIADAKRLFQILKTHHLVLDADRVGAHFEIDGATAANLKRIIDSPISRPRSINNNEK